MNVENLQKLYRTGQRILRERLPIGFGEWDCGTYACLAGWYGRDTEMGARDVYLNAERIFGIGPDDIQLLFACVAILTGRTDHPADLPGPAAYAELEKRMEYLAGLIREAGGTVPGEKTGLPDIVRDIFRVEEAA